jgi:hypothetical protein
VRKCEQPGKAKTAVAMDARVRRLAAFVAADERLDYSAAKFLAQVERDVRDAERVACSAGSKHRIGRAAGTFRVRPVGIEPEPQGDTDRIGQRLEQRDSAVDTAAHRNRNPTDRPRSPKDRPDRVSERVDSKRLPTNGSSLEQSQPNKRTIKPRSISLNNALAVERKPHKSEFGTTSRITNELNHKLRLAAIPASAGFAGARHPQPKRGSNAFDRREVIMRAAGAADFATTRPCRVLRRCEPG